MTDKVFMAELPIDPENLKVGFTTYGNFAGGLTYPDGSKAGAVILVPDFLVEQLGNPQKLTVAFSTDTIEAIFE